MALGALGRFVKFGTGLTNAAKSGFNAVGNVLGGGVGQTAGKIVGKTATAGFKTAVNIGNAGIKGVGKLWNADWKKIGNIASNQAKLAGQAVGADAKALNNIAGVVTGGFTIPGLAKNGKINKFVKSATALVKDDPDTIFGKKFTKMGGLIVGGVALGVSAKDAAERRIRAHAGQTMGLASNAPINTYAGDQTFPTMGASYANNAGATGDLALSLHRQRHTGIL